MRDNNELRQLKAQALDLLREQLPEQAEVLHAIDPRLLEYMQGVAANDPDWHNLYEVLGALKFLRILRLYPFDAEGVQHVLRCYEGRWADGRHVHGSGGLKLSGLHGRQYYRLTPVQVFILSGIFGPHTWVSTGDAEGTRPLLPTERVEDGIIMDYRRLVIEAVLFIPRKAAKTTMGAFLQFFFFFFGDYNSEGYCCANSADQAKILYKLTYDLIHQLDPLERRIRFTASEINWKTGQPRASRVVALTAGGKAKDGLFAQVCSSDEYGSADYVNGKSDMAQLVNVVEGSMGPRREPLTIHTTTAGNVLNGPFEIKLRGIKELLEGEIE